MGEVLVPTRGKMAKRHYKEVILDQFRVTRVDTEVEIVKCGEEHQAHPIASPPEDTDGDVDWSRWSSAEEAHGRRASLASFAWLA